MNWMQYILSEKRGKAKPKYCKYCGLELVPNNTVVGYNEQTGEAIRPFSEDKHCPSRACRRDNEPIYDY
jgi:hypothetical protein